MAGNGRLAETSGLSPRLKAARASRTVVRNPMVRQNAAQVRCRSAECRPLSGTDGRVASPWVRRLLLLDVREVMHLLPLLQVVQLHVDGHIVEGDPSLLIG